MNESKNEASTHKEIIAETELDACETNHIVTKKDDVLERLINNYKSLLSSGEIYYPFAYRFMCRLGSGQQGVVFQVLRQGARGCVTQHAIKLHDPSIYPTAEKYWTDMGRIASQVSKLQKVNSPQLLARDIYEEVNGIGYTQMEVIEGIDIHDLIRGDLVMTLKPVVSDQEWDHMTDVLFNLEEAAGAIKPGVVVYIMRQVLRGLEVLHGAGFLHSDIKPANMMVDRLGIVKLIDYGRAVMVKDESTFLLGTPLYMAPEQHRLQRATIQSDLYSLGLVGLELLRGKPLADPSTLSSDEMLAIKEALPQKLPELMPACARNNELLIDVFRLLLDTDPTKRYSSAVKADTGPTGLIRIYKQLAQAGFDAEYDREMQYFVNKVLNNRSSKKDLTELLF